MSKIVINHQNGKQEILEVLEGGQYLGSADVIWDERENGELPEDAVAGKIQVVESQIVVSSDYIPEHNDQLVLESRASKIAELRIAYVENFYASIEYDNKTWSADDVSQTLLSKVLSIGLEVPDLYWRDSGGTAHEMSRADLQGLALAIAIRCRDVDQNLVIKTQAVNAAQTLAEIDAIEF